MQYSLFDNVGNPNVQALRHFEENKAKAIQIQSEKSIDIPGISNNVPIETSEPDNAVHNTDDAGAELTYNRRNRDKKLGWTEISAMNDSLKIRETVKHKIYPKPAYQALMDAMPFKDESIRKMSAHIIKQVYDAISNAPIARGTPDDAVLQTYVSTVNRVMDRTIRFFTEERDLSLGLFKAITGNASSKLAALKGQVVNISDLVPASRTELLNYVYPDNWRNSQQELRLIGISKILSALQPSSDEMIKAMKDIELGWPNQVERWQKQGYRIIGFDPDKYIDYTSEGLNNNHIVIGYIKDGSRRFEIFRFDAGSKEDINVYQERKIAETQDQMEKLRESFMLFDKRGNLLSAYSSEELAIDAARDQCKPKRITTEKIKGKLISMVGRKGPEYRKPEEDISSDRLMQEFNLKGVNFGNWMKGETNDAERQLHLNHAYDAMMDLSSLMDISPEVIGMNRTAGLAIGAQGRGGTAAAHFVPGVNEFNITREEGAGFLGHEYGHGIDHLMAKAFGHERSKTPFLSNLTSVIRRNEKDYPELMPLYHKFMEVYSAMMKRPITQEELTEKENRQIEKTKKNIKSWVASIEHDFKAANVSLDKLNVLKDSILAGEYSDQLTQIGKNHYYSKEVVSLRELYKAETGRMYPFEKLDGLQYNISWMISFAVRDQSPYYANQKVDTDFSMAAQSLDEKKGGELYWSTPEEMFARSFETYLFDKLNKQGRVSQYLTIDDYSSPLTYPQGEERQKIVAAMDGFVREVGKYMQQQFKSQSIEQINDDIESVKAIQPDLEKGIYKGKVISITQNYIYQQDGDNHEQSIRHEKNIFFNIPPEKSEVEIRYKAGKAFYSVIEQNKGRSR